MFKFYKSHTKKSLSEGMPAQRGARRVERGSIGQAALFFASFLLGKQKK